MKYFVVLAVFAFSVCAAQLVSDADKRRMLAQKYSSECMEQRNVTEDTFKALQNGEFEIANNDVECFANCFLEKYEFINNGVANRKTMFITLIKLYGPLKMREIVNSCKNYEDIDKCKSGFNLLKCLYEIGVGNF